MRLAALIALLVFSGCDRRLVKTEDLASLTASQRTQASTNENLANRVNTLESRVGPLVDRINEQNKSLQTLTEVLKSRLPPDPAAAPTPLPTQAPTPAWPSFSSSPLPGGRR